MQELRRVPRGKYPGARYDTDTATYCRTEYYLVRTGDAIEPGIVRSLFESSFEMGG